MEWMPHVDKLVLEMLFNRTPPTCIQANILATARTFMPGTDIVKEIPSLSHIRNLRTVLLTTTKTLAAYEVGNAIQIKQTHSDETSKRQTGVLNVVNGLLTKDNELKTICLAGDIIPENGTAEEQSKAVVQSFSDGARLLDLWRDKTAEMFKDDTDLPGLLVMIPEKDRLCITRLLGGYISTDTCATARSTQTQIETIILDAAKEMGMTDKKKLVIHFGNCHNHIRNIWTKALEKRMKVFLTQLMQNDLDLFPPHLRISCDLYNIHW